MPNPVRSLVPFAEAPISISPAGVFEGYAALFEVADLAGDVIVRGAFADTLRQRRASGIRLLFQHDPKEPIGVWLDLREDERGLRARGRLLPDVARARDVAALIRGVAIDGLSIGFRAVRARREARSGIRRLERIDLWEISVVTFPMQPGARIAARAAPFTLRPAAPPAARSPALARRP